jgi:hypothetical protein
VEEREGELLKKTEVFVREGKMSRRDEVCHSCCLFAYFGNFCQLGSYFWFCSAPLIGVEPRDESSAWGFGGAYP